MESLSITRGDSEQIEISLQEESGASIPLVAGDKIYFTVKTSTKTEDITFQKVITSFNNGVAIIDIEPNDTKNLAYGDYRFDVQYNRADGYVRTIVKPSIFTILSEVTYD